MVRCFAALPIAESARASLERVLAPLRDLPWPVRWVRPEGVHVTLRFYGEVPRERADAIIESLDFAVAGIGAISLAFAGFGAFPAQDRPRVLWAGIEAPSTLEILQDRIETRAEALGFASEGVIFRPHVTIGRVREGERIVRAEAARLFATPLADQFLADEVVLYESVPGPGGAVYTPLHQAGLRG
jgi:2'-5' RNA ligase